MRVEANKTNNYELTMSLVNGSILARKEEQQTTKIINSYAAVSFEYRFCIKNGPSSDLFHIRFHQGLELADLNKLPQMDDVKIIEQIVDNIGTEHRHLVELQAMTKASNEYSMGVQKLISFKTVGFGFLGVIIIVVVSFLHYLEIRRLLRNRKII